MHKAYIFTSDRLGFRNWSMEDLDEFAAMNSDPEVMEYFPNLLSRQESADFIERLQAHFEQYKYNYFATEILATGELIGFIGLAFQSYETDFTPAVDIGWRLKKSAWGNGFATEGAERCLEYVFIDLNLCKVISTCTEANKKSERLMVKIGLSKQGNFKHPQLVEHPVYINCVWYTITRKEWLKQQG